MTSKDRVTYPFSFNSKVLQKKCESHLLQEIKKHGNEGIKLSAFSRSRLGRPFSPTQIQNAIIELEEKKLIRVEKIFHGLGRPPTYLIAIG
jgi:hypothetical protein